MAEKIVISLGGSVISGNPVNIPYIEKFSRQVSKLEASGIGIVVGGGKIARDYILPLRKKGVTEFVLDMLGIEITRVNALLVASIMGIKGSSIPGDVETAAVMLERDGLAVMGGTEPGHTTDAVAMLLAERVSSRIMINISNVDGVYDRDPSKNKDAKLLERLDYDTAMKLSLVPKGGAGPSVFLDPVSITIARRSGIDVYVISGRDLTQLERILEGKTFHGSIISDQ
ncbi:MAG: UMP kinase [Candidatus Thermoplasmatota archaeon]|nr:UMP kinase [Candidatus Thermoplasmatota archaeon]